MSIIARVFKLSKSGHIVKCQERFSRPTPPPNPSITIHTIQTLPSKTHLRPPDSISIPPMSPHLRLLSPRLKPHTRIPSHPRRRPAPFLLSIRHLLPLL